MRRAALSGSVSAAPCAGPSFFLQVDEEPEDEARPARIAPRTFHPT